MEVEFIVQAQRFVRSAVFCTVPLGLAFGEWCLWGVGCGRAIGICAAEMAILVDGSVVRTGRNHSKCMVWCKFC